MLLLSLWLLVVSPLHSSVPLQFGCFLSDSFRYPACGVSICHDMLSLLLSSFCHLIKIKQQQIIHTTLQFIHENRHFYLLSPSFSNSSLMLEVLSCQITPEGTQSHFISLHFKPKSLVQNWNQRLSLIIHNYMKHCMKADLRGLHKVLPPVVLDLF
ncbi:hypothetical protein AMECASPLE_002526 [Ameca splendens]|uniref:Secreted protein n=1 Tax=Ameca splendens TaxID=208324 RepID=A0ABV0YWF8_9TELE